MITDSFEMEKLIRRKLLTSKFFKSIDKMARFTNSKGEVLMAWDRYCIEDLGVQNNMKGVYVRNINSCAPFKGFKVYVREKHVVEKYWERGTYSVTYDDGYVHETHHYPSLNDIKIDIVFEDGEFEFLANASLYDYTIKFQSDYAEKSWNVLSAYLYLVNCIECFKDKRNWKP